MHLNVDHPKLLAILTVTLVGVLGPSTPVLAEPVTAQGAAQASESAAEPGPPMIEPSVFVIEEAQHFDKKVALPNTTPVRSDRMTLPTSQGKGEAPNASAQQRSFNAESDGGTAIHSRVKDAVRPVYDQLTESGVLEAWHDLKSDLGLNKDKWSDEGQTTASPARAEPGEATHSPWQDPGRPPKTAAQAQMDRELDAFMLKKLIDDVKPWFFGLIGLYALGYLIKAGFHLVQWKSARRRERRAARAAHRPARRTKGIKPDA